MGKANFGCSQRCPHTIYFLFSQPPPLYSSGLGFIISYMLSTISKEKIEGPWTGNAPGPLLWLNHMNAIRFETQSTPRQFTRGMWKIQSNVLLILWYKHFTVKLCASIYILCILQVKVCSPVKPEFPLSPDTNQVEYWFSLIV